MKKTVFIKCGPTCIKTAVSIIEYLESKKEKYIFECEKELSDKIIIKYK